MLKIRLKKFGRKKSAAYRIIAIDSRKKRDGRAIEELGFYNPITKEKKINIDQIKKRIQNGAQVTLSIQKIINQAI
uniref:Small ribosomal subunit protein bS16c n=1 Tax=Spyridia filamentosa TaxID=196632 RepID=A0A1Z1MKB1_SPYFI|nr:ribosomal protein S16 [Spyridia filamentosa]ARW66309.1 ribosomal protein S16 [Spyridia filamentosa]